MTELETEIRELSQRWVCVGTNEGTYGDSECLRAVGCGDPKFGNCTIYEQVGTGKRRVDGPDPDQAPGYIRRSTVELVECQRRLAALRQELRPARRPRRGGIEAML